MNIARMLLLRGLKMDPLPNKLLWIILLKVVGSTTYSNPTTSRYEDKCTVGVSRVNPMRVRVGR